MSNIKKEVDQVTKQERELGLLRENLKCTCVHTKKGDLTLVRVPEDASKYRCKQCQKVIKISRLDDKEIQDAIDVLDRMVDTIKLSSDVNREDDAKMVKKLAKFQFRLRNEIMPFYNASIKKNNQGRGKRNNNNRNDNYDGGWNKPTTF